MVLPSGASSLEIFLVLRDHTAHATSQGPVGTELSFPGPTPPPIYTNLWISTWLQKDVEVSVNRRPVKAQNGTLYSRQSRQASGVSRDPDDVPLPFGKF